MVLQPEGQPDSANSATNRSLATEVTDPDEYKRLYGLAEKVYAGWSDYLVKTATAGRTIPVFRLVAR